MMRWNLALLACLALVHLWPIEVPPAALLDQPGQATPFELHVLASRGELEPERFGAPLVEALLAEPAPLGDMPWTGSLCKFGFPRLQLERLRARLVGPPDAEQWLDFFFQFRKTGGFSLGATVAMRRHELDWTLAAMQGQAPPPAASEATVGEVLDLVAKYFDAPAGPPASGRRQRERR